MSRPDDDRDAIADGRDETPNERADRNYAELLQELRVAQTGVQILFAFLLTLPFTQRFHEVGTGLRWLYVGTLLAATVATACLIAPVSHHRILFHQHRKPYLVRAANRLAHIGLAALMVAILGAVFLVVEVVVSFALAVATVVALAVLFVATWYLQPLRLRTQEDRRRGAE
jgi:Family of unknown function (DUF6328)